MRFAALPPVRRAVPLTKGNTGARYSLKRFFADRRVTLYASGTAAMARAIRECAAKTSVDTPEVILPAYGCPDLVAACLHESVFPRLVDVAANSWAFDVRALEASISCNTVAIVAVNLLGLGDDAIELARLCRLKGISLIQDSAQYLPRAPIDWPADYVVLSFGRGKPLNMLHGGALIGPISEDNHRSIEPPQYTVRDRVLASSAAAIAFNVLTRPHVYRLLSALPGTGLGEVIYRPLNNARPLPERAWRRFGAAFAQYRDRPSYQREPWTAAIDEWATFGIAELRPHRSPSPIEPLRLALLAPDRIARNTLVTRLNQHGLGASHLYGTDLPHVAAIPAAVYNQGPFPHATILADRLFTLPTHSLVTTSAVRLAREIVCASRRSRSRP